jgi:UDP:flavonoid glycosyltransferase YjiC (YdhE family)
VNAPAFMDRGRGFHTMMGWMVRQIRPVYERIASRRPQLVVAHPLAFGARAAEAKLGVRTATVVLSPAILRSAHEPPVLPGVPNSSSLPGWYKRGVWWAADRLIIDPAIAAPVNAFRAELGLAPLERVFQDGWRSPHLFLGLFPEWFAPRQPDWPQNFRHTGFPLHDEGELPAELARFLDAGDPPIVITAGTGNRHGQKLFAIALEAAGRLRRRAIALTPFADQVPPGAVRFDWAPLGKLLPRAAALVHHGGIGTSAAGLAAGVPQVVFAFSHDQPDNAARLERLGVAAQLERYQARDLHEELARLLVSGETAARLSEHQSRLAAARPLDAAADALEVYAGADRCAA